MTFSFYHSLKTLPHDLNEAVTLYRLPVWQRFSRLELPAAAIGLLWNAMMSFGGGWFFVAASEAISVLNKEYTLPGIGSYVTKAVAAQDMKALLAALVTIGLVILLVDQLFWRPLVAWGDKFKLERSASAEAPHSWLLNLLRSSRLPALLTGAIRAMTDRVGNGLARRFPVRSAKEGSRTETPDADRLFDIALLMVVVASLIWGIRFILSEITLPEVEQTLLMGMATFVRVLFLVITSTLLWVPVGVAIGFHPRVARFVQPIVQFLASFPANFLFPFATLFFMSTGVTLNVGTVLLMALGAQWYILFNTIAGAMNIPNDLREMARSMGLKGWRLWRALIIPGIFSAWVTGGITASGGAWNAWRRSLAGDKPP
jgi:NitT/TauT family transport system permease protein